MIQFDCSYQWEDESEDFWHGIVKDINSFGSHYEIFIESRSSMRMLIGRSTSGMFACLPDFSIGCHLSTLDDVFYNREKLIRAMENAVDGTTAANALKALSNVLRF